MGRSFLKKIYIKISQAWRVTFAEKFKKFKEKQVAVLKRQIKKIVDPLIVWYCPFKRQIKGGREA